MFCRTRHRADRVAKRLGGAGVDAVAIHGGRSQPQRDRALRDFTTGRALALVATDVAARGIHVDDVAAVVHFDLPPDPKDYVHRSGRTARAGQAGVVVALVAPDQRKDATKLARQVGLDVSLTDPDPDLLEEAPPRRPAHPEARSRRRPKHEKAEHEKPRRRGCEVRQAKQRNHVTAGSAKRARVASASERPRAKTSTAPCASTTPARGSGSSWSGPARTTCSCTPPPSGASTPPSWSRAAPSAIRAEQGRKGEQAAELHLAKAR